MKNNTKRLVNMGVLIALSVVLVYLIRFPLFPAAPFLEYDPADIPIIFAAFAFGPLAGFIVTVIASVIQGITVSAASGIIGIVMHILATGSFVIVAGNIYKRNKTKKAAIIALVSGVLTMTATMVVWNIIFTPIFLGAPLEAVMGMLVPIIIPFNLIKASVNGVITLVVYKRFRSFINEDEGIVSLNK
ncbi:ECF transporter S component [Cellulosilyticum sp. I15G10I2]|uniref:ECF transporter S component n=1 Tax=Cellulosilyticum sp. I15G10I2 TaxID=1892843 RepID=UPI00085CB019|nr:ECF transporter S component [Cellulosilyticum sp. I15G10I2]